MIAVPRRSRSGLSGEDRLIASHFKPLAHHPGALGLVDDAAFLRVPAGQALVLTVDAIVAGVHFFPDDPPDTIARKALRVNLSDLAAKGAKPAGFLLTLALPNNVDDRWLGRFARSLGDDATRYACPLLGGDTVTTPGPLTVSVTAFGTLPSGSMVRRDGARLGERVFVSGTIGDAALGLMLRQGATLAQRWGLSAAARRHLLRRYLVPEPRNALASAVRRFASGAMDVSDGLAGDLAKLCRASGVAAEVEASQVPLSAGARSAVDADPRVLETVLSGGDDYEIVCTVPASRAAAFQKAARASGIAVTDIGRIVRGEGAAFFGNGGRPLRFKRRSFSHF